MRTRTLIALLILATCCGCMKTPAPTGCDKSFAACVAPIPEDLAPIRCGETKAVDFRFTTGPDVDPVRAYSVRVKCEDGLTFSRDDITVHAAIPPSEPDYIDFVYQRGENDWSVDFAIAGSVTDGVPSGADLFTIVFHGSSGGTSAVYIEESRFRSLVNTPVDVDDSATAWIKVKCRAGIANERIEN